MGFNIGVVQRDYNGAKIERNAKGEVTKYEIDELSEQFRKKNIEKFGKLDKSGNLTMGKKVQNLDKKNLENIKKEIEESNRRFKVWQQEQQ